MCLQKLLCLDKSHLLYPSSILLFISRVMRSRNQSYDLRKYTQLLFSPFMHRYITLSQFSFTLLFTSFSYVLHYGNVGFDARQMKVKKSKIGTCDGLAVVESRWLLWSNCDTETMSLAVGVIFKK